jgi:type II secretory pathway pseudopilin PulG
MFKVANQPARRQPPTPGQTALPRLLNRKSQIANRKSFANAFTLTEVLIAVAIGLLLLIGVSQIFSLSGNTISQGYALGELTRRERALSNVLRSDFLGNNPGSASSGFLPPSEQPLIAIRSERQVIFRDRADLEADLDGTNASGLSLSSDADDLNDSAKTLDLNEDGDTSDPQEDLSSTANANEFDPNAVFNQGRNHRKDTLAFFTRSIFKRQTGQRDDRPGSTQTLPGVTAPANFNTGTIIDLDGNGTRPYAFVWYGHLRLPDNTPSPAGIDPRDALEANTGDFHGPGAGNPLTNPNNYFPTQWTLGRMQVILDDEMPFEPDGADPSASLVDRASVHDRNLTNSQSNGFAPFVHLGFHSNASPVRAGNALEPFGYGTRAVFRQRAGSAGTFTFDDCDSDDLDLAPPYADNIPPEIQHSFSDYAARRIQGRVGPQMYRSLLDQNSTDFVTADNGWWRRLIYNYDPTAGLTTGGSFVNNNPLAYRFNANPFVTRPVTWQSNAQNQPILFKGCSQFIVEFAGDYVTQNNNPADTIRDDTVTAAVPDGVIDFYIREIRNPDNQPSGTVTEVREIAWYGMPRDVDGDGTYDVQSVHDSLVGGSDTSDTVLNRRAFPSTQNRQNAAERDNQRFERSFPRAPSSVLTEPTENASSPNLLADGEYVAVWGPKDLDAGMAPKLIRVTIQMLDANGRVPAGLTREFIYRVRRD